MKTSIFNFYIFLIFFFFNCSENEDFSTIIIEPEIVSGLNVKSSYLTNQNIKFQVIDDNQNDISEISVFFVDGQQISEDQITHSSIGNHNVYAEYNLDGQFFNTQQMNYSIVNPINKLLLEDFTGTWCGYCPPVKYAIELARDMYPDNITVVATHQNDQYAIAQEQELISELGPFGLPEARINRITEWVEPYDLTILDSFVNSGNNLAISISSEIQNNFIEVSIRFVSRESLSDHKLVVYMTENNLEADQSNYLNFDETSYFYNLGNPIPDYIHNDVLRHTFTNVTGDDLQDTEPYEDFSKSFSLDISNSSFQNENLSIIAFIVNADNLVINSQSASVGEFQDLN